MATYNKNKPDGNDSLQDSDNDLRDNFDVIEDAFSNEHTFPGTYGSTAGQHVIAPCFSVHKNGSDQTISSTSTWTKLTWPTEELDNNSDFASDKFTVTVAGLYDIKAVVQFHDQNGSGIASGKLCQLGLYKNGVIIRQSQTFEHATSVSQKVSNTIHTGAVLDLIATDFIEIFVWQNNSVTTDVFGAATLTHFDGQFIAFR